jgi:hypothetical protein
MSTISVLNIVSKHTIGNMAIVQIFYVMSDKFLTSSQEHTATITAAVTTTVITTTTTNSNNNKNNLTSPFSAYLSH